MKDLLHPAEQEVLDELAEEFDDDLDLDSIATILHQVSQSRTRQRQPHIIKATNYPVSLLSASSSEAPSKPARKKKKSARLSVVERERFDELGGEVKEVEKNSRRLPAVLALRELKHLFQTVRQARGVKARRDYLILRTLYATGCRRSELENILYADLKLPEQQIFIRDGKWNKDRYVLIDKQTASLLEEYTAAHTDEMPLFDIEDRQINRRVVHWGEKSGIAQRYDAQERSFTAHSLRHCFATHMWENGADLYTLRELLGHRYLSTTKFYVSIGVGKLLGDYEKTHPLNLHDEL